MNTFELLWSDSEDLEHKDYYPTYEEAKEAAENLKLETDIVSYKIERIPEL